MKHSICSNLVEKCGRYFSADLGAGYPKVLPVLTPPLFCPIYQVVTNLVIPWSAEFSYPPLKFGILLFRTEGYPNSCLDTFIQSKRQPKLYNSVIFCAAKYEKNDSKTKFRLSKFRLQTKFRLCCRLNLDSNLSTVGILAMAMVQGIVAMVQFQHTFSSIIPVKI